MIELTCRNQISSQLLSIVQNIWLSLEKSPAVTSLNCFRIDYQLLFRKGAQFWQGTTLDTRERLKLRLELMPFYMGLLTNYMAQGVGKLAVFLHQANVKFPAKSRRSGGRSFKWLMHKSVEKSLSAFPKLTHLICFINLVYFYFFIVL